MKQKVFPVPALFITDKSILYENIKKNNSPLVQLQQLQYDMSMGVYSNRSYLIHYYH